MDMQSHGLQNLSIYHQLQQRERERRPIRVGVVGAGATGRAIALQLGTPVPGIRLAGMANFDIAIAKSFKLPFEGHRLQLRGEAFNAFNHANFYNPNLDASSPSTFGEYTQAAAPRVMQFGLRYEF